MILASSNDMIRALRSPSLIGFWKPSCYLGSPEILAVARHDPGFLFWFAQCTSAYEPDIENSRVMLRIDLAFYSGSMDPTTVLSVKDPCRLALGLRTGF